MAARSWSGPSQACGHGLLQVVEAGIEQVELPEPAFSIIEIDPGEGGLEPHVAAFDQLARLGDTDIGRGARGACMALGEIGEGLAEPDRRHSEIVAREAAGIGAAHREVLQAQVERRIGQAIGRDRRRAGAGCRRRARLEAWRVGGSEPHCLLVGERAGRHRHGPGARKRRTDREQQASHSAPRHHDHGYHPLMTEAARQDVTRRSGAGLALVRPDCAAHAVGGACLHHRAIAAGHVPAVGHPYADTRRASRPRTILRRRPPFPMALRRAARVGCKRRRGETEGRHKGGRKQFDHHENL